MASAVSPTEKSKIEKLEPLPYVCPSDKCYATFFKLSRLKTHLATHETERKFVCLNDDCTKAFKRPDHLKRHELEKHSQQPKLVCTFESCSQEFSSKHVLRKHIKRKHEKSRNHFKCSFCEKVFLKNRQLKVHEFQHTNVKPFLCTVEGCDKSFVINSHLTRHLKCHKGYTCQEPNCGQVFNKWTLIRKHKKECHPPAFQCLVCTKTFKQKCSLRMHMLTHESNQLVFSCPHEDCGREYLHEKSVSQHIKSCHQEPKYICTYEGCDKRYKHKVTLVKHQKEHSMKTDEKKVIEPKKRYKYHKHKSAAATLSGYEPSREEERTVLQKDKEYVASLLQETRNNLTISPDFQAQR